MNYSDMAKNALLGNLEQSWQELFKDAQLRIDVIHGAATLDIEVVGRDRTRLCNFDRLSVSTGENITIEGLKFSIDPPTVEFI